MLVAVMFLLAIMILSMAVAVPRIRADIQRDREVETMHRGKQYARAIKLYYKKFNAYPPNIDALVKTNNIRFLRKRYIDPMTGKDDWKPIMFGQNKAPLAMGFFGQPLAGGATALAGTGPMGGNGVAGASSISGGLSGSGSAFSNGSSLSGGSGGSSIFNSGQNGGSDSSGASQGGTGQSGSGTSGSSSAFGSSGSLSSNQTFGGAGIIGFEPGSDKESILTYKKKNHYNEWEFTYSPLADQMQGGNLGGNGQPINNSNNGTGLFNNNGTGTQNGIFQNNPTTTQPTTPAPTTPTSPQ